MPRCSHCHRPLGRTSYAKSGVLYCSEACRALADDAPDYGASDVSPVTAAESVDLHALMSLTDGAIPWPVPKRTDGAAVADGLAALIEAGRWR